MKKKLMQVKNENSEPLKAPGAQKIKISSKKASAKIKNTSENKSLKQEKKLSKKDSSSKYFKIDHDAKEDVCTPVVNIHLTEPLRNQCHEMKSKLLDQFQNLEFKGAIETVYKLYAKAKLLHEVYGSDSQIYYEALLQMALAHRFNNDIVIAGKHFKRVIKLCNLLASAKEETFRAHNLKKSSLIGLLSIYVRLKKIKKAKKIFELLEEEDLSNLTPSEKLEVVIDEAELILAEGNNDAVERKLVAEIDTVDIIKNALINPLLKLQYVKLLTNTLIITGKPNEALEQIEYGIQIIDESPQKLAEEVLYSQIDLLILRIQILNTEAEKPYNSQKDIAREIVKTYELIKEILIYHLSDKINEQSHRQFFSPLRKYIIYLSRNSLFKETLSVLDNLIALENKYYGKFHLNLAKSLELKGKIYSKMGDPAKAFPCFEQALTICTEMNEKDFATTIKDKMLLLTAKD